MKKRIIIAVCLILCFCLSGCVSNKKYNELEKRVSYLESLLGVSNSNEDTSAANPEDVGINNDYYKSAMAIALFLICGKKSKMIMSL